MSLSIYDEGNKVWLEKLAKRKDLLGLDHVLDQLVKFVEFTNEKNYPPTSIEKKEDGTIIIYMALAGFKKSQIQINLVGCELVVMGKKEETGEKKNFIQQGIAFRSFEKKFLLSMEAEILGAKYHNGMLEIVAKLPVQNIQENIRNIRIEEDE